MMIKRFNLAAHESYIGYIDMSHIQCLPTFSVHSAVSLVLYALDVDPWG